MIHINYVLLLLIVHWFADFVVQTDEQAKNKSTSNIALLQHVTSYTAVWALVGLGMFNTVSLWLAFVGITFTAHFITDWCTSRIVKSYFDCKDYHMGFVVIGIDQVLHYVQIFLTLYLLSNG